MEEAAAAVMVLPMLVWAALAEGLGLGLHLWGAGEGPEGRMEHDWRGEQEVVVVHWSEAVICERVEEELAQEQEQGQHEGEVGVHGGTETV